MLRRSATKSFGSLKSIEGSSRRIDVDQASPLRLESTASSTDLRHGDSKRTNSIMTAVRVLGGPEAEGCSPATTEKHSARTEGNTKANETKHPSLATLASHKSKGKLWLRSARKLARLPTVGGSARNLADGSLERVQWCVRG